MIPASATSRKSGLSSTRALDALNFFLADVRDGLGPYLSIYLLTIDKWDAASIGWTMTAAAICGLIAQTPAGAFIDRTKAKRAVIIVAALAVTVTATMLPVLKNEYLIVATQSISGIAAAFFAPAIAAITLGIVGPRTFALRTGRNEAFNHAGNAATAGAAAALAYFYGPAVVFWIMGLMAVFSIGATLAIPASIIDDDVARGLEDGEKANANGDSRAVQPSWRVLLQRPALLTFAATVVLFHLSNAAMLPLVGQKLALRTDAGTGTSLMAACIVAAQIIMVPAAWLVGRKADVWGRKPFFLVGFGVLALRGLLYPLSDNPAWLLSVQALDGVGAGIFGALFPVVVADLTRGSGHFNVSLGAIATATGIGAALSTAIGGMIVVHAGYSAAFISLAAVAGLGLALYAMFMPETREFSQRP